MRNQLEPHAHVASSSVSAARLSLLTLFLRSFRAVFACPERPKDHLVSLYPFCFAFQSNEFYWNVCMAPQTNCTARFGLLFFLCLRFFLFFLRLRLFVLLAWLLSLVTPPSSAVSHIELPLRGRFWCKFGWGQAGVEFMSNSC